MESHNDVLHQMEKVRSVFQDALLVSREQSDFHVFEAYLKNVALEFRSVAYEGIGLGLALKDFADGSLRLWRLFVEQSEPSYASHAYIGLGWAIAKQKLPSLEFLEIPDPLLRSRVIDGYGYYDGTFRPKYISNQERPAGIENKDFQSYDQGLGRSLWYSCNALIKEVSKRIQDFSSSRHPDLWRGIGIACAYVGGCDRNMLTEILSASGKHKNQLAVGAAIAIKARVQTDSLTKNTELICHSLCNHSIQDITSLMINAESLFFTNPDRTYRDWLLKIDEGLLKVINLPAGILN